MINLKENLFHESISLKNLKKFSITNKKKLNIYIKYKSNAAPIFQMAARNTKIAKSAESFRCVIFIIHMYRE